MTSPDWGELAPLWDALAPKINEALDDGHYLKDTPEVRKRLGEADELAKELDS